MTIASVNNKDVYDGDGVTINWPITFPIESISSTEILVYKVSTLGVATLLESNYTVDLTTPEVIYPTEASELDPLTAEEGIILLRQLPLTQEIDYKNQGTLPAETIEEGVDRLTMIAIQLQEQITRAILVPVTETVAPDYAEVLETATTEAQASAAAALVSENNAEAAEIAAEAAQAAAEAAVASVDLPVIGASDSNKLLQVKTDRTGYEFITKSSVVDQSNIAITGGSINGVTIGASAAPTVTNLGAVTTCDINGGTIDGTNIGASTPGTVAATTLKVGTTNQGDILYDNGTSLVRLTPGDSGKFLKTQGAAANPVWDTPVTATVTVTDYSASSTVTGFTGTPTTRITIIKNGRMVTVLFDIDGTSNANTFTLTVPNASSARPIADGSNRIGTAMDNGVEEEGGKCTIGDGSSTVTLYRVSGAAWTTSNRKFATGSIIYVTDS